MKKLRNLALGAGALLAVPGLAIAFPGHGDRAEFEAVRDEVFVEADANGDGALSITEFETFHELIRDRMEQKRFAKIDADGSGGISLEELEAAKGPHRRGPR